MPELPEVQTVINSLIAAGIPGRRIEKAEVRWPRIVSEISSNSFCRRIQGVTIESIGRRGKYILFGFNTPEYLLIHLRMTGRLLVVPRQTALLKHVHVIFHLDDKRCLHFQDTRKFGRMHLTKDPSAILDQLGPEPLSPQFTSKRLEQAIKNRKRLLKPLLLDQTVIAGLGNIYVDEALWESKLHPLRIASDLTTNEISRLHRAIRKVLRKGINNNGTSLGEGKNNFVSAGQKKGRNQLQLNIFRRTGLECPRCGQPIQRIIVSQRSTHICNKCQNF